MSEMMSKEKWTEWFLTQILPASYNEWGISKEEFRWVSGWNDLRQLIISRLIEKGEEK